MRKLALVLAFALAAVSAFHRSLALPQAVAVESPKAAQAAETSAPPFKAPPESIARMRNDVEYLASPPLKGRRAGTLEADQAASFVAQALRKAGILPAGSAGTYLQSFDFIDGVDLGPNNKLVTAAGTELGTTGIIEKDYRPLAFSTSGKAEGEVVFAGYGISAKDLNHDDYEGLDVKGKVVLVLRYGPDGDDPKSPYSPFTALRYKATTARQNGAAAVLFVTGPRTKDVSDDLVALRTDSSFTDAGLIAFSLKRPVAELLFKKSAKTLEEAQKTLDETRKPASFVLAGTRVEIVSDVTPRRVKTSNVIGVLQGSDPALNTEFIVVGAHYDHLGMGGSGSLEPNPEGKIHPGADDNASGVSTLLELARLLVSMRQQLKRSVLFVSFGAEELGTLGSLHFTKNSTVPFEKITAMINLDMVGRLRNDNVDVQGTGTSSKWAEILERANAGSRLNLRQQPGGFGPSDHSPFYTANKPVLFFFTGAHGEYHRPSDTAEKILYDGQARILSLLVPIVLEVSRLQDGLPFVRVAGETRPSAPGRGRGAWVGTIPDFSEEKAGFRISAVTPGSPAEKAGILGGDLMTKFGGKDIRNIYDYTYALQEHKPGDKVAVEVKRKENGSEVTKIIEVTLGSRPSSGK